MRSTVNIFASSFNRVGFVVRVHRDRGTVTIPSGMPFTKDTITSLYEKPVPMVANATREVLKRNGTLLEDNVVNNTFQAKVNQRNVWVKVADRDGKVTEVFIQVRGNFAGDVDLAAELKAQIALQLVSMQNK